MTITTKFQPGQQIRCIDGPHKGKWGTIRNLTIDAVQTATMEKHRIPTSIHIRYYFARGQGAATSCGWANENHIELD